MLTLKRDEQSLTILPDVGAALVQWQVRGHDILRPVANEALRGQKGIAVGAYPLLPYVNRLAKGQFAFGGEAHQLALNMEGCPHSIHGNGWEHEWQVSHKTESHAILTFEHKPEDEAAKREWPYAYRAVISYELRADGLHISLVMKNCDERDQPVGFGFHPFFHATEAARLTFNADSVWLTDKTGLPETQKACEGEWDFSKGQALAGRVLDNGFAGFTGSALLEPSPTIPSVTIKADGIFSHLVVFSQLADDYVAIEPVTSMTDALNRPDSAGRGVHVLAPGQSCGGMLHLHVEAPRRPAEG
ncbi:aldose 1-epimerase [Bombella sp. ESL0378]|uniref:aldose 1-epimerase n=1 Tax=Bombella sp. ESL0378 TaxID=2676442 RepID=UPI0012D9A77F|nr:aldose 1-epimerase [Bombella sp. ESL0378]MUG04465.1 aldose 1-epimerase [Bombella sp. ESL0378]